MAADLHKCPDGFIVAQARVPSHAVAVYNSLPAVGVSCVSEKKPACLYSLVANTRLTLEEFRVQCVLLSSAVRRLSANSNV